MSVRVIDTRETADTRFVILAAAEDSWPRYEIQVVRGNLIGTPDEVIGFRVRLQLNESSEWAPVELTPMFLVPFVLDALGKETPPRSSTFTEESVQNPFENLSPRDRAISMRRFSIRCPIPCPWSVSEMTRANSQLFWSGFVTYRTTPCSTSRPPSLVTAISAISRS